MTSPTFFATPARFDVQPPWYRRAATQWVTSALRDSANSAEHRKAAQPR